MGLLDTASKTATRARYGVRQGLRSAWYGAQYAAARRQSAGFNRPGEPAFSPTSGSPDMAEIRSAFFDLFRDDLANVEAGLYPMPPAPRLGDLPKGLARARAFLADVADVDQRRLNRDGTAVRRELDGMLDKYPVYYRQNFHYQTGGWLSDDSAALYDHQVEVLFTGAAAAMRRSALAPLAEDLTARDQRTYHHLDLACGTGQFLSEVLAVFPKLRSTGLDLSPNYVARAAKTLAPWPQVELVEGAGEAMPFDDGTFDAITNIYLFHELPPRIRPAVLAEMRRVLKPGGLLAIADSLQFGDRTGLDGMLEYFPEGFHEPYYKGYLSWDVDAAATEAGFEKAGERLAFLTKATVWRAI
ncbi:MAG: class I SAM-dependent methyltransferase [Pseudomonadota bacterium]